MTVKLIEAPKTALLARDQDTFSEWGSRLTIQQFLKRESRLRAQSWASKNMKTWFLVDALQMVCSSCETFLVKSFWNGEEGHSYAIASVFTAQELRRKRHASEMLKLLVAELIKRDPKTQSIVLFSDVGAPMYMRFGFERRTAFDRVFDAVAVKAAEAGVTHLTRQNLEAEIPGVAPKSAGGFVIEASAGQLLWRLERQAIYADFLKEKEPKFCGAKAGNGLAVWAADHKDGYLKCLLFEPSSAENAQLLLDQMTVAAREAGLKSVMIWETPTFVEWDKLKTATKRIARDGSLPMLKAVAQKLRADDWNWIPAALWV